MPDTSFGYAVMDMFRVALLTFVTVNPAEPELLVLNVCRALHKNAEPLSDFKVTPNGQLNITLNPAPFETFQVTAIV